MQRTVFELDFDKSRVLLITESDRPEVAGFKTRNRIELRAWLHFVDTKESLITKVKAEFFQHRWYGIPKQIGRTVQPVKEIQKTIEDKGIKSEFGKSQHHMFKWIISLSEEPKHKLSDSKCFARITLSCHGQPDYRKDFEVDWLDAIIGRFKR